MYSLRILLFLFVVVLTQLFITTSPVLSSGSCSITTSRGQVINLSSLDISGTGYTVAGTDPQWSFYFNICGGVTNPSTATCTTISQGYLYSKSYNLCYSLGQQGNPKLSFLNPADDNGGVKVTHSGIASRDGVTRQLTISLTCDPAAADRPTLTFSGESREGGVISYGFSGKTKTSCAPKEKPLPRWGEIVQISINDYTNISYRLDSVIGQPQLSLKFLPTTTESNSVEFFIGDCLKNGWSSIESVSDLSFYQNYGCVSLIAQDLNSNKSVTTVWEFSDSNQDMFAIVQTNGDQQVFNAISNGNGIVQFKIQPSSSIFNLYYSKQIQFQYVKLSIGEHNIQTGQNRPLAAKITISPEIYYQILVQGRQNNPSSSDVYIGKRPITWNIEGDEFFNYDYHLSSVEESFYLFSGISDEIEYHVVFGAGSQFKFSVTPVNYLFTLTPLLAVGILLIVVLVALCAVILLLLVCINRKKEPTHHHQELHEQY